LSKTKGKTLMKLTKLLTGILACAAISAFADASTATPKKVGPVSYYGALHTSGNKIIGAKNNQQAMLRGVSLFWSDATGASYYNPTVISWAVDNLKIDMFRYAMAIEYYDSDGGTKNKVDEGNSYKGAPEGQMKMIDRMVQAAIENDVYIVIDWHSHRAHVETSIAKDFFSKVSQKYKDVPNIIYEIYNEPVSGSGGDWGNIKNYASSVVPAIRAN
jgi:endoglucanase